MAVAKDAPRTLPVTIRRAGARRYELRDRHGHVLDTVDSRIAALDLVNALKRECDAGWRIEVRWVGCEPP